MTRLFSLFISLFFLTGCSVQQSKWPPERTASVIKVVDGDTLKVALQGVKENVRLIGIDTPESKANLKAKRDAERSKKDLRVITSLGHRSYEYMKNQIHPGDLVYLEFDVSPRDKYGRLLAYVYLSNGEMLNEKILRNGYASMMTYPPNVKYVERFKSAFRYAREKNLGLWGDSS